MKAVAYHEYGGADVLQVVELEKPEVGENDVLVQIGGSGLNPVDTYFRKGIRPVPHFPAVPHFDLGGMVVEAGSKVTNVKNGDRVWATNVMGGTAKEYASVPSEKLFKLPEHVTEAEGAAVAMAFMTAHLSLFHRAGLTSGETVLVYGGSGAVGHAAIQLAKQAGATVIATAGSNEKAEICHDAGADDVILYKEEKVVAKVEDLTGDMGVDMILDMSLSENIKNDLAMIKVGGRIVTIGSPVNNTPELPWRELNQKHASLMGVLLFTAPPEQLRKAGEEIASLLEDQKVKPHLAKTFPFEEATEAHQSLEDKVYNGNIVLVP
ncbi:MULTISPECIES: NADPH:quinone reductase [Alteribacter]|uniref:NADPH:quinone reductase n=1 Tax=Alteribacter keqinensis TaxID=2483800 RepID=A0A3M7TS71_9BACI|nr:MULTISPECIES: NADPH:quinone reductase [Alteribacter]MBM7097749.1 NADPH:quinone reductase [Alteribacter salitolerans]RNA67150.1 NADPH:quinone reductase [Alteribacter keqinensis]